MAEWWPGIGLPHNKVAKLQFSVDKIKSAYLIKLNYLYYSVRYSRKVQFSDDKIKSAYLIKLYNLYYSVRSSGKVLLQIINLLLWRYKVQTINLEKPWTNCKNF
jgi:hypothetical protein